MPGRTGGSPDLNKLTKLMCVALSLVGLGCAFFWGASSARMTSIRAGAHVDRGDSHAYERELDEAIAEYTRAIELQPTLAEAYCKRGIAHERKGQSDLAIADYTAALGVRPFYVDAYSPSIAMIYQAELEPDTVTFNNNMVIFDGANMFMAELDSAMSASNNLIVDYDPGVVNLAGTTADAFDLVAGSEAIDQGLNVPTHTLDFLNRTVPDPSGLTDIGAFEDGYTAEVGRHGVMLVRLWPTE